MRLFFLALALGGRAGVRERAELVLVARDALGRDRARGHEAESGDARQEQRRPRARRFRRSGSTASAVHVRRVGLLVRRRELNTK